MNNLVEVKLSSGWRVRCRVVPPLAFRGLMDKPEFWYPPPPVVEIKVQKGKATETVPAPEGSPEYVEYHNAIRELERKKDEQMRWFCYSYGVVEWVRGAGTKWSKEPPKNWEVDKTLVEMLDVGDMPRRTAFIMYELIAFADDLVTVDGAILKSDQEPLKGGEVQAAEDSFQGDVEE
jgi:hypothetical protein